MHLTATRPPLPARRPGPGHYLLATFRHPRAALIELTSVRHGARLAGLSLGAVALLYALVEWLLYRQGQPPVPAPFLRIATERYYLWATLFAVPTFLAAVLLSTAVMQLFARASGGHGRFEKLTVAVAWSTAVATLITLIPDLAASLLGVYGTFGTTGWSRLSPALFVTAYLVAFAVLFPSSIRAVHRLGKWRSALIGVTGFVVYQGFLLLFLR